MSITWSVRHLTAISSEGRSLLDSTPFWNSFLREKTLEFISKAKLFVALIQFHTCLMLACKAIANLTEASFGYSFLREIFFSVITLYTNKLEHLSLSYSFTLA